MNHTRDIFKNVAILFVTLFLSDATAGTLISRGKPVFTSSGASGASLVDGKFAGYRAAANAFPITSGSWIAINVGVGPKKVFVNWNNPVDAWSNVLSVVCSKSNPLFTDYTISTSSNSTNGKDGNWTVAATVTGNIVTARGHVIDFTGAGWVKLTVTKANSDGFGTLDEIEVFDITKSADIWFFAGTSITQKEFKEYVVVPNFADQMDSKFTGRDFAIVRGGIGCIRSANLAGNMLRDYLAAARNASVWAVEMGTNDGWGGGSANVGSFTKNMQEMIDSCKAEGIVPIIAHSLATNPAKTSGGWQLDTAYIKAIDGLVAKNHLIAGPDFYGYFKSHPGELVGDGVHPSATGAASMQRLWVEVADAYSKTTSIGVEPLPIAPRGLSVASRAGRIELHATAPGTAFLYSTAGRLVEKVDFTSPGTLERSGLKGILLVRFLSSHGAETSTVMGY